MVSDIQGHRGLPRGVPDRGCLACIRQTFSQLLYRCAHAPELVSGQDRLFHISRSFKGIVKTIYSAEQNNKQPSFSITRVAGFQLLRMMAPVACEKVTALNDPQVDTTDMGAGVTPPRVNPNTERAAIEISPERLSSERVSVLRGSEDRPSAVLSSFVASPRAVPNQALVTSNRATAVVPAIQHKGRQLQRFAQLLLEQGSNEVAMRSLRSSAGIPSERLNYISSIASLPHQDLSQGLVIAHRATAVVPAIQHQCRQFQQFAQLLLEQGSDAVNMGSLSSSVRLSTERLNAMSPIASLPHPELNQGLVIANRDSVVAPAIQQQGRQLQRFAQLLLEHGSGAVAMSSPNGLPGRLNAISFSRVIDQARSKFPEIPSLYTDSQGYKIPNVRLPVVRMENMEWQIGDDGEYIVLGTGSFGSVRAAYYQSPEGPVREVAVKRHLNGALDAVIREAKMMEFLSDTGVFPKFYGIVDIEQDRSEVCLVSELFGSGQTLWEAIHCPSSELTRRDWHNVAVQVALALKKIHAKGVLYNDLKGNNLLLDTSSPGQPVLRFIDVGLSTYQRGVRQNLNPEDMGKYPHIAPEVKLGVPTSHLSDVWGLGLVFLDIARTRLIPELEGVAMSALACHPSERAGLDDIIAALEAMRFQDPP